MSIEVHVYDAIMAAGPVPIHKHFKDALTKPMAEAMARVDRCFAVYDLTIGRIIKRRNAALAEDTPQAYWGYNGWSGLHVVIHLGKREGFDSEFIFDAYERLKRRTLFEKTRTAASYCIAEPAGEDMPEIKRRSFCFTVGDARATLLVMAHSNSEICEMVEDGTQPKYKLICKGSPI